MNRKNCFFYKACLQHSFLWAHYLDGPNCPPKKCKCVSNTKVVSSSMYASFPKHARNEKQKSSRFSNFSLFLYLKMSAKIIQKWLFVFLRRKMRQQNWNFLFLNSQMPSCDVKNELQNRSKEEIHGRHMKSRFKKGSQNDILLNGTHCEHIYFIYKKLSFF